jgi:hypothetical protein
LWAALRRAPDVSAIGIKGIAVPLAARDDERYVANVLRASPPPAEAKKVFRHPACRRIQTIDLPIPSEHRRARRDAIQWWSLGQLAAAIWRLSVC